MALIWLPPEDDLTRALRGFGAPNEKPLTGIKLKNHKYAAHRIASYISPIPQNLVDGSPFWQYAGSMIKKEIHRGGVAWYSNADTVGTNSFNNTLSTSPSASTLTVHLVFSVANAVENTFGHLNIGTTVGIYLRQRTYGMQCLFRTDGTLRVLDANPWPFAEPEKPDKTYIATFTFKNGVARYFVDGLFFNELTGLGNIQNLTTNVGFLHVGASVGKGSVVSAEIYNTAWSDEDVRNLHKDYYNTLYEPANDSPFIIGTAAAGGTELSVTTGALTVAGTNATISQARNVSVTTGALAIAGVNVSVSSGTDISVGTGALVVAGTNATISQARNIVATTGALVIGATAASIEVNRNVSAGTGAIVVAGVNAVVDQQITGATNIVVTTGAVTVTGTAAVINQITELGITTGAIVVSGVNASIASQNSIDVSTGALTIAGTNAGIIAGAGISVSPGTVTITGYNATITGLVWTEISDTSTTWTPISEASSIWTEI